MEIFLKFKSVAFISIVVGETETQLSLHGKVNWIEVLYKEVVKFTSVFVSIILFISFNFEKVRLYLCWPHFLRVYMALFHNQA